MRGTQHRPPSGSQFVLVSGEYRAVVVEVGAGIRVLTRGNRAVLDPYEEDSVCDGAHGAVLVPWPNRVLGGRYRVATSEFQLDLTEPSAGNAIHGLVRWRPFTLEHARTNEVVLATRIPPTPGYPFDLAVTVHYQLRDAGLVVRTIVENEGSESAPVAIGHHPYLSPGAGSIDGAWLQVPSALSEDRELADVGSGIALAGRRLDHTIRLDLLGADRAWALLTGVDGAVAALWAAPPYRYLQLFSGDTLASERRRCGLAVEPMTAPPNALATGNDIWQLTAGEGLEATWGRSCAPRRRLVRGCLRDLWGER